MQIKSFLAVFICRLPYSALLVIPTRIERDVSDVIEVDAAVPPTSMGVGLGTYNRVHRVAGLTNGFIQYFSFGEIGRLERKQIEFSFQQFRQIFGVNFGDFVQSLVDAELIFGDFGRRSFGKRLGYDRGLEVFRK